MTTSVVGISSVERTEIPNTKLVKPVFVSVSSAKAIASRVIQLAPKPVLACVASQQA